jgi:hypothetical protein
MLDAGRMAKRLLTASLLAVMSLPTVGLGACGRIRFEGLPVSDGGVAGWQESPALDAAVGGTVGGSGDAGRGQSDDLDAQPPNPDASSGSGGESGTDAVGGMGGYAGVPGTGGVAGPIGTGGAVAGAGGAVGDVGGGGTAGAGPLEPLGRFDAPTLVEALSHSANDDDPCFTEDRLELYFTSNRPGGLGGGDIWVSRRVGNAPWGEPELVAELSSSAEETTPGVSPDGLTLWLATDRRGCVGGMDIWVSTRASRAGTWSAPVCVAELSSRQNDLGPAPTSTLLEMVLTSSRSGLSAGDLYLATRSSTGAPWGTPEMIAGVSSSEWDGDARLVRGGLELYMASNRLDPDDGDLYLATRSSTSEPFSEPEPIAELNSRRVESDPWISEDRRYIVFTSDRSGDDEIYEASR